MRSRAVAFLFAILAVTSIQAGCDGGTKRFLPALDGGANLTCADGEFRLVGTISDQSIDLEDSSAGGGWVRINPANFDTQYSSLAEDPTRTRLSLAWKDDFMKNTFDATGTLLMGTAGVLPGQSFCLGAGTQVNFPSDNVMEFKLESLRGGVSCDQVVSGGLIGCFQ
jgi:hypothetical protein